MRCEGLGDNGARWSACTRTHPRRPACLQVKFPSRMLCLKGEFVSDAEQWLGAIQDAVADSKQNAGASLTRPKADEGRLLQKGNEERLVRFVPNTACGI